MFETLSEGTRKRISRINRRATAEVREAFENGLISSRRADVLLYLSPIEQREQLKKLLSKLADRERRYRMASETIERYLEGHKGRPVDLQAVAHEIRAAVA